MIEVKVKIPAYNVRKEEIDLPVVMGTCEQNANKLKLTVGSTQVWVSINDLQTSLKACLAFKGEAVEINRTTQEG